MTQVRTTTDPFTATEPGQRHQAYAQLARTGPVHRITLPTGTPAWLVTGHDEVRQVLNDPRVVKGPALSGRMVEHLPADARAASTSNVNYRNPPDHTRLRRLVGAAFTRRLVEQRAPRIRQLADELLDALGDEPRTDLMTSYASPLPTMVLCELLGIPVDDWAAFHRWSTAIMANNFVGVDAYVAACTAMVRRIRELAAAKRATPADDLITALTIARDGADRLTEDELIGMVMVMVIAGHETTVNLIGNSVHALLTHPDQLALLRAEPDRLAGAIEEVLRYAPPVQLSLPYLTTEPVRLGASTIPAGQVVVAGLLAANRDPTWITAPTQLDITRAAPHHLTFGHGIHHCFGAPLARLEGRIALHTLLSRFPRLRLAVPSNQVRWAPGMIINGLAALPVALR